MQLETICRHKSANRINTFLGYLSRWRLSNSIRAVVCIHFAIENYDRSNSKPSSKVVDCKSQVKLDEISLTLSLIRFSPAVG